MKQWITLAFIGLFAATSATAPQVGNAAESETDAGPSDTVMVLDASGSMWGQIDGVAKIEIARGVINDMLGNWPQNHRLGLMAYGHRREADCQDIESLIELGDVDPARFANALATIKPKGKTPLTAAVQQAAKNLAFTERPATVILVSDGLENCNLDPCAVGAQLEEQGVDFTAHVIGFDVGKEDTAGLRCLAESTGGTYADAEDAGALSGALEQVVEDTRTEPILLVAVLEAGGEPLTQGVSWYVQHPEADFEGKYKVLYRTGAAQGKVNLDNGNYRVVARRGATRVPVLVEVDDKTRRIEVVLAAGDIRMQAALGPETEPLQRSVSWRVYEPEPDFDGNYKQIAASGAAQAKFTLPAGEYRITAKRGATEVASMITVVGGEQKSHLINLNAGDIRAVATLGPDGAELKRAMSWEVQSSEADFDGKYTRITSTGADQPLLTLPAGAYRLLAKRGQVTQIQPITVEAGKQQRISVAMDAGEVIATAHLGADTPALKGVSWQVQNAAPDDTGKYKRVLSTGADEPRMTLPSGAFRLLPKRGYAEGLQVIEVSAGSQSRYRVILEAGEVRASLQDAAGQPVTGGVSWSVYHIQEDGAEQRAGATGAPKPLFTLSAGKYRIQARTREGTSEQVIDVAPGQQQQLIITQAE